MISLGEQHSFPLDVVFEFLRPATVEEVLSQALLPMLPCSTARWRWNASRALAIPRYLGGRKTPPPIQRMRADDLLAAVFPDQAACPENLTGEVRVPDHPLVKETIANCLHEAMDLNGLRALLEGLNDGAIRTAAVDTPEPSPFSHEILNSNPYAYLDDAPLEERRARMVQMRRSLPADQAETAGALDPAAIEQVAAEAWPPMRDAEELHEALCGFSLMPAGEPSADFDTLVATNRASVLTVDGTREFWVPAERSRIWCAAHTPSVPKCIRRIASLPGRPIPDAPEACAAEILRGWFECSGPLRASELARERLAMSRDVVDMALAQLEAEGQIPARPIHPSDGRSGMVPSPPAGAHTPSHHRPPAARNRARYHRGAQRLPGPLAAPGDRDAIAWRGWRAADHPADAGL